MRNQMLVEAEKEIEARIPDHDFRAFMTIVVHGMRAALAGGTSGIWGLLERTRNPLQGAASTALNLAIAAAEESEQLTPPHVLALAAEVLMLQALDLVHSAKIMPVGEPELAEARRLFKKLAGERLAVGPMGRALAGAIEGGSLDGRLN